MQIAELGKGVVITTHSLEFRVPEHKLVFTLLCGDGSVLCKDISLVISRLGWSVLHPS